MWFEPVLRLEIAQMFRGLSSNPYDDPFTFAYTVEALERYELAYHREYNRFYLVRQRVQHANRQRARAADPDIDARLKRMARERQARYMAMVLKDRERAARLDQRRRKWNRKRLRERRNVPGERERVEAQRRRARAGKRAAKLAPPWRWLPWLLLAMREQRFGGNHAQNFRGPKAPRLAHDRVPARNTQVSALRSRRR